MFKAGDAVIYSPHPGGDEEGVVTEVLSSQVVRVRYNGDEHSKTTYTRDLRLKEA